MGFSWRFSDLYRLSPLASVLCLLYFFALFAASTWLFITVTLFYYCLLFIIVHTLRHWKPSKLSWCSQYPLAGKQRVSASSCIFYQIFWCALCKWSKRGITEVYLNHSCTPFISVRVGVQEEPARLQICTHIGTPWKALTVWPKVE